MALRFSGQNPPDDKPWAEPSCPHWDRPVAAAATTTTTTEGMASGCPVLPFAGQQEVSVPAVHAALLLQAWACQPSFLGGAHGHEITAMPIAAWAEAMQLAGSAPGSCLHKSPP